MQLKKMAWVGALALAAGVGTARAQGYSGGQDVGQSGSQNQDMGQSGAQGQGTGQSGSEGQGMGQSGSMGQSGMQQGAAEQPVSPSELHTATVTITKVDRNKHTLDFHSQVLPEAKLTKNGTPIRMDQLKEGDQVRASFDPRTGEVKSLEVISGN